MGTVARLLIATAGLAIASAATAGCDPAAPTTPSASGGTDQRAQPSAGRDGQPAREPAARPSATRPAIGPLDEPDAALDPRVSSDERNVAPLRIVSAAPNVTEILCALGWREALVGRTRYCDYPPGVEDVRSIGALLDFNTELLMELDPDLVLIAGTSAAQTDRLAPLDINAQAVPDTSLDDLFTAVRGIGRLTHRPKTAEMLSARIRRELAAVDAAFEHQAARRVLIVTGTLADPPRPPYVASGGSFYHELLARVGHRSALDDDGPSFAPVSLESILQADPDVIIELDPDGTNRPNGDADARRVWGKVGPLTAVRERRVHVLPGSAHYVLGPRIARTYAALCRKIASGGSP